MTSFVMTWSSKGWPYENLRKDIEAVQSGEQQEVEWRTISHKSCSIGDRIIFLNQGKKPKGIFGYGRIVEPAVLKTPPIVDKNRYLIRINVEKIVDPTKFLLIPAEDVGHLIDVNARASGYSIDDGSAEEMEKKLLASVAIPVHEIVPETGWSRDELEAAVDAYLEMLRFEQDEKPYSKSAIRVEFLKGRLKNRTKGSFEYRMQNISAVLKKHGGTIITGYKPAYNIGANEKIIVGILESKNALGGNPLPMMVNKPLADIAAAINKAATSRDIGNLQQLRKKIQGLGRLPTVDIFNLKSTFDEYAFHAGGREELQFNIGYEEINGELFLRSGVALSLAKSRTVQDISHLIPKIYRLNEFLHIHPGHYADCQMWRYTKGLRSEPYAVVPIQPEYAVEGNFIFLGKRQPASQVSIKDILDTFDRFLPLYTFVEGNNATFPVVTDDTGNFDFVPGNKPKPTSTTANHVQKKLNISLRHNEIQDFLYTLLTGVHGKMSVSTEQASGRGTEIDLVVKTGDGYWFYEVKTASCARACIREAVGQLLEYSYWPKAQEADRLIVVGEAPFDEEARSYLSAMRQRFKLPIYYQVVDMKNSLLIDEGA